MIPEAALKAYMDVKRQPGEYERDTVLRALEAALPELLVPEVIKHIVDDLIADMYHPEFGTEWREPDGSLWKITDEIEKRAKAEEKRRIMRLISEQPTDAYYPSYFTELLRNE
jgi:hypothetical protein